MFVSPSVIDHLSISRQCMYRIIRSRGRRHWLPGAVSSFRRRTRSIDTQAEEARRSLSTRIVNVKERSRRVGRTVDTTGQSPIYERALIGENGNEIRPRVTEHREHPRGDPHVDQVKYRLSPDRDTRRWNTYRCVKQLRVSLGCLRK